MRFGVYGLALAGGAMLWMLPLVAQAQEINAESLGRQTDDFGFPLSPPLPLSPKNQLAQTSPIQITDVQLEDTEAGLQVRGGEGE
ncbi:MAG: hypothetical protein AAFV46_07165, partial [Cyanobacteria bacterium J06635_11]